MLYKLLTCIFVLFSVSGCDWQGNPPKYEIIYNGESKQNQQSKQNQDNYTNEYTIAVVPKVSGIPYFNAVKDGALEAGRDLGVNVLYMGPTIADWEHQEKIIEELVQKKVNAIAVSANDPTKLGPVLAEARKKGIKVITWDSDTDSSFRELFINTVDPETLGRHLADTLARSLGEQGSYAIMTGSLHAANLNEWMKWTKVQQQKYYPNMKLLEVAATNDAPAEAYEVAKGLLEKHPTLTGIIGLSSVGPPAAAQAVQEAGKQGKIAVVGLSTPNLMRADLKSGAAQIITLWSPKKLGYLTVRLAKDLLEGNAPYDGKHIKNIGDIEVKGDMVIMGQPIDFTKENIDQYDF